MELYSEGENYKLYHGNMLDMLDVIDTCSIDAIVTDPPYELGFMGKNWDNSGIAFQSETWKKCLNVLKPGGYLLAFGGSRTFHRIACAIEDAGFEIRDTILWLYGSGFPKSMNIGLAIDKKNGVESEVVGTARAGTNSKAFNDYQYRIDAGIYSTSGEYEIKQAQNEWNDWGTCLKPAYEPVIVARKPCEGSTTDNVLKYGVGGMNIGECRIGTDVIGGGTMPVMGKGELGVCNFQTVGAEREQYDEHIGRFPSNVILTYDKTDYVEVCGGMEQDDISASRYFYTAKASKRDRDEGLENFDNRVKVFNGQSAKSSVEMKDVEQRFTTVGKNIHPTVKPCDLMQYLVRLVTPNGGTVLDPFNGSGSTGKAVMYENVDHNKGYKYIGIEITAEYLPISKARIEFASKDKSTVEGEIITEQGEVKKVVVESLF